LCAEFGGQEAEACGDEAVGEVVGAEEDAGCGAACGPEERDDAGTGEEAQEHEGPTEGDGGVGAGDAHIGTIGEGVKEWLEGVEAAGVVGAGAFAADEAFEDFGEEAGEERGEEEGEAREELVARGE